MSARHYEGVIVVAYLLVFALILYGIAQSTPLPHPVQLGPQCTVLWPHGYTYTPSTPCRGGDIEATWGQCVPHYNT